MKYIWNNYFRGTWSSRNSIILFMKIIIITKTFVFDKSESLLKHKSHIDLNSVLSPIFTEFKSEAYENTISNTVDS